MNRDFCICCGAPIRRTEQGVPLRCTCEPETLRDLETQETRHLSEYQNAGDLQATHFDRYVRTDARAVSVWDLLAREKHDDLIQELPVRATDDGLVQLIYQRFRGCRLVKWRWAWV